jgi:hypothetical protein
MKVINQNIIIDLKQSVELKNGINLKETRGKRDIVNGVVFLSSVEEIKVNAKVWFPLYASNEINVQGKLFAVVHKDDIIMVQEDAKL